MTEKTDAAPAKDGDLQGKQQMGKWIGIGIGAGIGSAAIAAALLYTSGTKKKPGSK